MKLSYSKPILISLPPSGDPKTLFGSFKKFGCGQAHPTKVISLRFTVFGDYFYVKILAR